MDIRALAALAVGALIFVQGCVTSPIEALEVANPLVPPKEALPPDQPGVSKTGRFPTFGNPPQRATQQLTDAEKAEIKSSLGAAAQSNDRKSNKQTQVEYEREVAEMKRLIAEQKRKRANR